MTCQRSVEDHPVVISAALDLTGGHVTGAIAQLGLMPDPHLARQRWFQGTIAGTAASQDDAHTVTDELIGRRVRYAYSSSDVYDHVYLNENLFTWFCVGGTELGCGDTESSTYWKLRNNTCLFAWLEKNLGIEGMVLIDLAAHRTVGIQFALDQVTGELVNITMGSCAQEFERTPAISEARPGRPSTLTEPQPAPTAAQKPSLHTPYPGVVNVQPRSITLQRRSWRTAAFTVAL
ncbi:MoaF C-terminal domain-containing protein [Mycobacterium sp. URHB0021]